jgi:PPOX class probable F420-dependent enzyme
MPHWGLDRRFPFIPFIIKGPRFQQATKMEPSDGVKQFSCRRYINLESYKKNGDLKLTPVQSIESAGVVYIRTDSNTWKVKRIRRNPHVRIVPSDRNGKPTGTWVEGEAHVLEGKENEQAMELFKKEYGSVGNSMVNFAGRLRGERLTTVISVNLRQ